MDTTEPRPSDTSGDVDRTIERRWPHRRGVGGSVGTGAQAHDAACPGPGQPAVPGRRDGEHRAERRPRRYRHTCGRRVRLYSPDLHRPGNQCVGARRVGRRNPVGLLAAVGCAAASTAGTDMASAPAAGVLGEDHQATGAGVLGRSGSTGTGPGVGVQGEPGGGIGVRGVISSASRPTGSASTG